jgi:hypothetical protein
MTTSTPIERTLVATVCVLLFTSQGVFAGDSSKTNTVPKSMCTKLKALLQNYCPKATSTNEQSTGVQFEYTLMHGYSPSEADKKHEDPIQRGASKGYISCFISVHKGKYVGQSPMLIFAPVDGGEYGEAPINRKESKTVIMVPYSAKRNEHLWVNLSYSPDPCDAFLKEFRAIIKSFAGHAD